MNVLLVYDTVFKNTKHIAERIFNSLYSDFLGETIDIKFISDLDHHKIDEYHALILASPTHNWLPTEKMINLIHYIKYKQVTYNFICMISTSLENVQTDASAMMWRWLAPLSMLSIRNNFYVKTKVGPLFDFEENHITAFIEKIETALKDLR